MTSRGGLCFLALLIFFLYSMAVYIVWYTGPNSFSCDESFSPSPIPSPTLPTNEDCVEYSMQIPIPTLPTAGSVSSQALENAIQAAIMKFFDTPESDREFLGLWIWPPPLPPTLPPPRQRKAVIPLYEVKNWLNGNRCVGTYLHHETFYT